MPKHLSLNLVYDDPSPGDVSLRLFYNDVPVIDGLWSFDVARRGKKLRMCGDWTEICEYEEGGCEYLEIDMPLQDDYRLQRHLILDHDDDLVILADTVLWDGEETADGRPQTADCVERSSTLPAAVSNLAFESQLSLNRDFSATVIEGTPGVLYHDGRQQKFRRTKLDAAVSRQPSAVCRPCFRVLPIAFPGKTDSKTKAGTNERFLSAEGNLLIYRHEVPGMALFAPLVFDFRPTRFKKALVWRQLTVGENLEKVTDDVAVGYRFQFGKEQFLLYHSLAEPTNRTVLGHNLIDDLCFARFSPKEGVEALLEVQRE